jgi:hypothetical protein
MKKNALPEKFLNMLRELKAIEIEIKKSLQGKDPYEHQDKLHDAIWENWPRKMLLNKKVLQMRAKALKNPKVKAILDKYHIGIENCALVDFRGEFHEGSKSEHECPAFSSSDSILKSFREWDFGNVWKPHFDYCWGGPKDQIKILFDKSNNNQFKAVGLIEMFPMKKAA